MAAQYTSSIISMVQLSNLSSIRKARHGGYRQSSVVRLVRKEMEKKFQLPANAPGMVATGGLGCSSVLLQVLLAVG